MEPINVHTREENTLNQRYFFKLTSNVITIFTGIFTAAIVPRALGVNAYGDFSYTNNVITQILNFLDMRASTCFYVKLSQRQSESRIITFYGIYTILIFALLVVTLGALTLPFSRQYLFEKIDISIVWISFVFVAIKWIADIFIKISDAYGVTQAIERIKIANTILSLALLVVLFYWDVINITTFYAQQILMFSILVLLMFLFFRRHKYKVPLVASMEKGAFMSYAKEFWTYSAPVAFYVAISLITEIFDRYILQHFGGSYQQGLYGFSYSMSFMMILFVTAMVPLFTRELSIAFSNDDIGLASELYRKYVPILYVVSAYFCCFLLVNADSVLLIFGGEQYTESLLSLRIMLLFPLVATYSNLNGSVVYAKSGTALFRKIAMVVHPIGMLATYFLISDQFMNLGAAGLAIKIVGLEFVTVSIIMLYISKHLKIKLHKYFLHMFFAPLIIILISWVIRNGLFYLFNNHIGNLLVFTGSGFLYTVILGFILYFFPILVGLSKTDVRDMRNKLLSKLR